MSQWRPASSHRSGHSPVAIDRPVHFLDSAVFEQMGER
jgi:hypothetical protein